ncbi:MAG: hypothetical protein J6W52_12730 [Bacteroidaceae bacterium]|nr:hypothetical protein [Bacteroidaceae bacterium]
MKSIVIFLLYLVLTCTTSCFAQVGAVCKVSEAVSRATTAIAYESLLGYYSQQQIVNDILLQEQQRIISFQTPVITPSHYDFSHVKYVEPVRLHRFNCDFLLGMPKQGTKVKKSVVCNENIQDKSNSWKPDTSKTTNGSNLSLTNQKR